MKFAVVFTACMALLAMQVVGGSEVVPKPMPDLSLLKIQQFFYEILLRLDDPLSFEEWIKLGNELVTDKKYYLVYDKDMETYVNLYLANSLQAKDAFFNPMQQCHIQELKGLFKLFYYPIDMEVILRNMVWARMNVNPGVFVQALTLVVTHHKQLQGIVLPEIDEIFPQFFVGAKQVMAVEKFDWDMWNRWIMLEKELKTNTVKKMPSIVLGKQYFLADFKSWQWWKLMGLSDGWQFEQKSMLRDDYKVIREDPIFQSIYSQMKMIWMPIDYSRDVGLKNDDSKLSYFTEDRSWNKYWYYLNMDYSTVLNSEEFGLDDRRGERWMFSLKQLVARYNLERYSHGLSALESIPWTDVFWEGYNPQLVAPNGIIFSMRQNIVKLFGENPTAYNNILSLETRIKDLLTEGSFMKNGILTSVGKINFYEFVGNLMQGKTTLIANQPWFQMVASYLGGSDYRSCNMEPNVIVNFETQLRDSMTYSFFTSAVEMYNLIKPHQEAYTKEMFFMPGVKIVAVELSPLKTFFDLVDLDMSTLLNDKMVFHDGKYVWDKVALGRQLRLNHDPFDFKIQVNANKAQKVVVRSFLTTAFDQYGQFEEPTLIKLDQFVYDLAAGSNTIERSSNDFGWAKNDSYTYSELYAHLSLAMEGKMEFNPKMYASRSLFPQRLILPRGTTEGLPVQFVFHIWEYKEPEADSPYLDDLPFDFPFDRQGVSDENVKAPNLFVKGSKIVHMDKFMKYYPNNYKHFGTFDEDF